ncbi:hypothetical protein ACFSFZ_14145 [Mixta tenebrionis]|uniref:hypothetical protein n=1 Tax=Mixta tenebrionis TaxID=2562439 RepID=UPI0015E8425B|nr:hypothetical protein [Mixta tenebrionis]
MPDVYSMKITIKLINLFISSFTNKHCRKREPFFGNINYGCLSVSILTVSSGSLTKFPGASYHLFSKQCSRHLVLGYSHNAPLTALLGGAFFYVINRIAATFDIREILSV